MGVDVLDCEHKTPKARESGYPYIAIPDVQAGRIDTSKSRLISGEDLAEWNRRTTPRAGDVLVTRRGRVGDSAPIPEGVSLAIGQNLVLLRSRRDMIDQGYLRWAARSPQWWSEVDRLRNVGAVFSSLNVKDISRIRIPVPPLTTQRSIAEVMGALDDEIAANTKTANLSDQLSSALFHDSLRHASWSGKPFADLATISGGGTPSTKVPEYWDGDVNWATPTDVTGLDGLYLGATKRRITQAGFQACSSALYQPGAILMTSRATIGAFAIAQQPTAVNQGFIVVQPVDPKLKWWLFHEMRSRVDEFLSLANGATFLELSRGNFRRLDVRMAEESVMYKFDARAQRLHDAAAAAFDENRTLAAVREALLPQLMSGNVRVKDAEKVVEGAL